MIQWAYYPRGLIHANIYFRRSDAIQKQLRRNDIRNVKVSRHHLGDWRFYVLEFNRNNSDKYVDEKDIAKALDIPTEWVYFIHIDVANSITIYWIDEEKLHEKYLDDDGELNFDGWSLYTEKGLKSTYEIEERLSERIGGRVEVELRDDFLFISNTIWSTERISKELNVPKNTITDVSDLHFGDLVLIIALDKVRKGC